MITKFNFAAWAARPPRGRQKDGAVRYALAAFERFSCRAAGPFGAPCALRLRSPTISAVRCAAQLVDPAPPRAPYDARVVHPGVPHKRPLTPTIPGSLCAAQLVGLAPNCAPYDARVVHPGVSHLRPTTDTIPGSICAAQLVGLAPLCALYDARLVHPGVPHMPLTAPTIPGSLCNAQNRRRGTPGV